MAAPPAKCKLRNSYQQQLRRHNAELSRATARQAPFIGPRRQVIEIRQAIASCKLRWQDRNTDRLRRTHAHHPAISSRDFFKRIAIKFLDNTLYSLGGPCTKSNPASLANEMTNGRKSTMQQPTASSDSILAYVDRISAAASAARKRMTVLDGAISTDEVEAPSSGTTEARQRAR